MVLDVPMNVDPWTFFPGPLVLIDLETTGLRATSDRIIEVAAVRQERGCPPKVLHTLVDPQQRDVGATSIHHITPEMVRGAPTINAVLPLLAPLCEGAVMVAHNASFEHRFLTAEMARCGGQWGMPRMCTLALARRIHPERKHTVGHRLGDLVALYGLEVKNAHTALGDVRMMSGLLGAMVRRASTEDHLRKWLSECTRAPEAAHFWPPSSGAVTLKPRRLAASPR